MKKYNLSEIMKRAWKNYNTSKNTINEKTFAECLKRSWRTEKTNVEMEEKKAASGVVRMLYSEYKNNYASCKTVNGSYDAKTKTIEVHTAYRVINASAPAKMASAAKSRFDETGKCRLCGSWCHGDCTA